MRPATAKIPVPVLLRSLFLLSFVVGNPSVSEAHDLDYAIATVTFQENSRFEVQISCHIAAYLLEAEAGHLSLENWVRLRDMDDDELQQRADYSHQIFTEQLGIYFDGTRASAEIIEFPDIELVREDGLQLEPQRAPPILIRGNSPDGAHKLSLSLPYQIGVLLLQATDQTGTENTQFVPAGAESLPIPVKLSMAESLPWTQVVSRYLLLGFTHILPKGLDHILFVLGLFLLTTRWKPLLGQITAFTAAHSLTLALSVYGVVFLPSPIIEPLIAFSIAAVAIENLFTTRLTTWRPFLVFGFGLLHGLGFASILREVRLNPADTVSALAGFNLGVEVGQLSVILLALLAVGWFRSRNWYRLGITVPASCCIALIGIYWTVQRTFFAT